MSHTIRVLAVEDNFDHFLLVHTCLAGPDATGLVFEVVRAKRLSEAVELLSRWRWDAVLLDLMLSDSSGLDTFRVVAQKAPGVPILITTCVEDEAVALDAMRLGAQDFILKGSPDFRMLKRAIRYAVERKAALEQRDQVIRAAADGMVVVDAASTVRLVNPAAARLFHPAALLGKPFPYPTRSGETTVVENPRAPEPPPAVEMRVPPLTWNLEPASLAGRRDGTRAHDARCASCWRGGLRGRYPLRTRGSALSRRDRVRGPPKPRALWQSARHRAGTRDLGHRSGGSSPGRPALCVRADRKSTRLNSSH